jgi:hypothetical protein
MEIRCRKCDSTFKKSEIIVTGEGLFCSQCIPEGVDKTFFTVHLSWQGLNAIIDFVEGTADVEQFMIIEKIKDKLILKMIEELRKYAEIPESDS